MLVESPERMVSEWGGGGEGERGEREGEEKSLDKGKEWRTWHLPN